MYQWGELYNRSSENVKMLYENIKKENYSSQTAEMLKLARKQNYNSVCEIGCGSGQTAIALALLGLKVVALDYQKESLELVMKVVELFGGEVVNNIEVICCNAQNELPFHENQFDAIYHAGLLEHYSSEERVKMLSLWKKYCDEMISMVPNGASVAYRYGKEKMIKNGTWPYGTENIIYTQILEFIHAGLCVDEEYTIGLMNSLNFLDKKNYLKKAMLKLWDEHFLEDDCHQGYLLVTRGRKRGSEK